MKMNGKLDFQDYIIKFFMSLIYRKLLAMFIFLRHLEWISILQSNKKLMNCALILHDQFILQSWAGVKTVKTKTNKNTRKLKSSKNPQNL